jgi:hypothetical protein
VEVNKLIERAIDNETRNRRNCLEFSGISQDPGETTNDIEQKILWVLQNKMNLNPNEIKIERCHRIGQIITGKIRSVIIRFLSYKMRQLVWKNKNKLKGSNIFVSESYPGEIKQRRRILPYLKCAQKAIGWRKAFLRIDKLIIDGKIYTADKVDCIPDLYKPVHTKTEDNIILFFYKKCTFQ